MESSFSAKYIRLVLIPFHGYYLSVGVFRTNKGLIVVSARFERRNWYIFE